MTIRLKGQGIQEAMRIKAQWPEIVAGEVSRDSGSRELTKAEAPFYLVCCLWLGLIPYVRMAWRGVCIFSFFVFQKLRKNIY